MKKTVSCIIIAFVVLMMGSVQAEGLLPLLSDTAGVAMPSLGEALQCYPDSETENDDGSVTELYSNVTETDYNTFSVYLKEQGAELADYHVEGSALTAEIRAKGASFNLLYDSKSGEMKVTYPSGTYDDRIKSAKIHFDAGQKLLEEGKTDEALTEFLAVPQYSEYAPVADLLQNNDNLAAAVAAHEAKYAPFRTLGNTVTFGRYEQDNNTANGPEEIVWIVLDYDEKDNKTLLLSRYGLDAIPYNTEYDDTTWEKCTLRNWLNADFMQAAFSAEEQAAILTTMVDNGASQGYSEWDTVGGYNTQDRIFLLSCAEAKRYLNVTYDDDTHDDDNNTKARVAPTAYAIMNGAWISDSYKTADDAAAGCWWLRSPGCNQDDAARVLAGGSLSDCSVSYGGGVVCPAFWINLESGIF